MATRESQRCLQRSFSWTAAEWVSALLWAAQTQGTVLSLCVCVSFYVGVCVSACGCHPLKKIKAWIQMTPLSSCTVASLVDPPLLKPWAMSTPLFLLDAVLSFQKAYLILCALNPQVWDPKLQPGPWSSLLITCIVTITAFAAHFLQLCHVSLKRNFPVIKQMLDLKLIWRTWCGWELFNCWAQWH